MGVTRKTALGAALALAVLCGAARAASAPAALEQPQPAASAAPWTAAPRDGGGALRFAVIGDRTGVARDGVFPQAMTQISWLAPDFVIAVGDLIEGYSDDRAELGREWDAIEAMVGRAGAPFVFTPGNHDLSNPLAVEVWRARHGPPYYAFTFKGALFLVLDTEDPTTPMSPQAAAGFHGLVQTMAADVAAGDKAAAARFKTRQPPAVAHDAHISDAQLAFVQHALEAHPYARWTFVFLHKPVWASDDPNWPKIEAALAGRPFTVFAGHLHYYSHVIRGGRDFIDMATTGAVAHREGPGTMDHTLLVTLTPDGPVYANLRLNGLADIDNATGQTLAH